MEQKNSWRTKYTDFQKLEKAFLKWHKKKAPNSFVSDALYMTYVFEYFLKVQEAGNVNLWKDYNQKFRDWLEESATGTKRTSKSLSYSTMNHCIRALNNFTEFCVAYNHMNVDFRVACKTFPQSMVGKRGYEDVITPDEFSDVHAQLLQLDQNVADFFYVAYHTGMRFNEIKSLPMNFLYQGSVTGPLDEELQRYNMKTFGYIVLESQGSSKVTARLKDNSVHRKPLKTRKKISAKDSRTIPITDKGAWNILARRFRLQKNLLEKGTFGGDKINYLLFDGLNGVKLNMTLKDAYGRLGKKPKSYHCCRHSKATYLVGETRSYFLGKAILGHKSDTFEDYLHIHEMIAVKAKQSDDDIMEVV